MSGPTIFDLFELLCQERVPNPGQKMLAGARVIRDSVISVIAARVCVTSRNDVVADELRVLTGSVLHCG